MTLTLPKSLPQHIGVTRVARVTGLDRTGVEVACAIRPEGHVLQVSNGKGSTREQARASALLEAAELWAAEQPPRHTHWGSRDSLGREATWDASELGSAGELLKPELWSSRVRSAWVAVQELVSGQEVLVPACALHCLPAGQVLIGPAVTRWSSNGMGAHPDRDAATQHALLEAIERDELARVLPDGWTRPLVRSRKLEPAALATAAPRVAELLERLAAGGFRAHLFDLSSGRLALFTAGALLLDAEGGPVPLTAGYACRFSAEAALLGALEEAAQSRLTDIHGAREDIRPADREADRTLSDWCERADKGVVLSGQVLDREAPASSSASVKRLVELLEGAGHARVGVAQLAPGSLGVSVVKVVVPGLRVSELL